MGYVGIPEQSDHRCITINHLNRSNHRFGFIACGIGCGVSDLINTWCVGIDCTIGIGGTVAIHNIVPLRSLIHVGGGCEMGHILISKQSDHRWGGVLNLDGPCYWNRRVPTAVGVKCM